MSRISTVTVGPAESPGPAVESIPSATLDRAAPIHPLWLRATHWLNAIAIILLVTSGWRVTYK